MFVWVSVCGCFNVCLCAGLYERARVCVSARVRACVCVPYTNVRGSEHPERLMIANSSLKCI